MAVPDPTNVNPVQQLSDARRALRLSVESFAGLIGVPVHRVRDTEARHSQWTDAELAAAKTKILAHITTYRTELQSQADAITATV